MGGDAGGRLARIRAVPGPAAGGLLTELIAWQSIFLVPLAIAVAIPVLAVTRLESTDAARRGELRETGRPHLAANLALGLVSAALAAALFLIVLLFIEGWRHSPIAAALAVSVIPLAALGARPLPGPLPMPAREPPPGRFWWPAGLPAWACFRRR